MSAFGTEPVISVHYVLEAPYLLTIFCVLLLFISLSPEAHQLLLLYIMSSVMVLRLAELPSYCDLEVTRRRYLTVQGPCGHTNKLCWGTISKPASH